MQRFQRTNVRRINSVTNFARENSSSRRIELSRIEFSRADIAMNIFITSFEIYIYIEIIYRFNSIQEQNFVKKKKTKLSFQTSSNPAGNTRMTLSRITVANLWDNVNKTETETSLRLRDFMYSSPGEDQACVFLPTGAWVNGNSGISLEVYILVFSVKAPCVPSQMYTQTPKNINLALIF